MSARFLNAKICEVNGQTVLIEIVLPEHDEFAISVRDEHGNFKSFHQVKVEMARLALSMTRGNVLAAAQLMRINRGTFARLLPRAPIGRRPIPTKRPP